jgi:hypothetical protein
MFSALITKTNEKLNKFNVGNYFGDKLNEFSDFVKKKVLLPTIYNHNSIDSQNDIYSYEVYGDYLVLLLEQHSEDDNPDNEFLK